MTRDQALDAIHNTRGLWFGATFIKRTTGEERRMVARTGVRKHLTGTGMAFDPTKKNLVVVWDAKAGGYRMIPIDGLIELRIRGIAHRF